MRLGRASSYPSLPDRDVCKILLGAYINRVLIIDYLLDGALELIQCERNVNFITAAKFDDHVIHVHIAPLAEGSWLLYTTDQYGLPRCSIKKRIPGLMHVNKYG